MRYDAEHKERTHQRIVAEAASAIRTKGPDRVGVAEVMAELGLTHGGFCAHFGSKDELIACAITYMFDRMIARFDRMTEGLAPAEAPRTYVDSYLSLAHRDAPGRGCALARLAGQPGRADAEALAVSVVSRLVGALALSRPIADEARSSAVPEISRDSIKARLGLGAAT